MLIPNIIVLKLSLIYRVSLNTVFLIPQNQCYLGPPVLNNLYLFLPVYNVNKPFTAQRIDAFKYYCLILYQEIMMLRQGKRLNLILVQDREL